MLDSLDFNKIFQKKIVIFLHFFMPIFSASHHPVLLSKVSIATAAAQGETYTKSPTFFIEKITKKVGCNRFFQNNCIYFNPLHSIQKN